MLHWLPSYFFWLAASVRGMAGVAWSKRKPACTALLIPSLRAWGSFEIIVTCMCDVGIGVVTCRCTQMPSLDMDLN